MKESSLKCTSMDVADVKNRQHFQENNISRICVNYNKEINMLMDGSVVLKINFCFKKCYVSLFGPHCNPLPQKRTINPKQADVACNKIVADGNQPIHFSSQVSISGFKKLFFLFLNQNICCVYSKESSH